MSKAKNKAPKSVSGVSQITGGACPLVTCDGKVWKVGFNTNNAKAALEQLIRAHVIAEAKKDGPEEYQDTKDRVLGGHYRTFAKGWLTVMNSPDGPPLYLQSLLLKHHPEATASDAMRLMTAAGDEVEAALAEVSPDFFRVAAVEWAREKRVDESQAAAAGEELANAVLKSFRRNPTTPEPVTASP